MRRCCGVLLMLITMTLCVCAEEPAQPLPADKKCSVPEDEGWTSQEKFVWHRVCIGETADFNKEPEYGGSLDPKKPDNWPQNRVLRPSFLETILLKDQYRRVLTRNGVDIVGARFVEELDLYGAQLGHGLGLSESLFEKGADLRFMRSTQVIAFDGSKFTGPLVMDGLRAENYVLLRNAELAEAALHNARIGAQLELTKSKVTGKLDMDGVQVGSSLLMGGAEFAHLILRGAHIVGQLSLVGSKVTGELDMDGLRVDRDAFLREAVFAEVVLRGARIAGQLELGRSKVTGKLDMDGVQIGSLLLMGDAEFADASLSSAHIAGLASLVGSKVTGLLNMDGFRGDQSVFLREAEFAEVVLRSARSGGQLELTRSKVTGKLDMSNVQVSPILLMDHAEFADVVLLGAHIVGQLALDGSKVTGQLDMDALRADQYVFLRERGRVRRSGSERRSHRETARADQIQVDRNARHGRRSGRFFSIHA